MQKRDLNFIYQQLRKYLTYQTLKKWKSKEYDTPNYWERNWIESFLKKFKLSLNEKRIIYNKLSIYFDEYS
ncbi:MAG: hypothetical protein QXL51_00575 [Candidatus Aenigmatarchaeota archaeon]